MQYILQSNGPVFCFSLAWRTYIGTLYKFLSFFRQRFPSIPSPPLLPADSRIASHTPATEPLIHSGSLPFLQRCNHNYLTYHLPLSPTHHHTSSSQGVLGFWERKSLTSHIPQVIPIHILCLLSLSVCVMYVCMYVYMYISLLHNRYTAISLSYATCMYYMYAMFQCLPCMYVAREKGITFRTTHCASISRSLCFFSGLSSRKCRASNRERRERRKKKKRSLPT